MPASSGIPRPVRIYRLLAKVVTISIPLTMLGWVYHLATKPYEVRVFVETSSSDPRNLQATIFSPADVSEPLIVTFDCPRNIEDLTYKPTLEATRAWSLRELLPAVAESRPFLTAVPSLDQVADRHLEGGLADFSRLENSSLEERVKSSLRRRAPKLTAEQIDAITIAFLALPNRHRTGGLALPRSLSSQVQAGLQNDLNQMEQEWERDDAAVTAALLQRWQAVTGTTLLIPPNGVSSAAPVYLSIPSLKGGNGLTLSVVREPSLFGNPNQEIKVSYADGSAYRATSAEDLKRPAILLVGMNYPVLTGLVLLAVLGAAVVFLSYRTWPKNLSDPDLYNQARQHKSDELWAELKRRNIWVDPYIVNSFFVHRAGLPGAEVIAYFWQTVVDTLNTTHVDAQSPLEVQLALQSTLDLAIQNAIA
jgi:hypothetical protein